MTLTSSGKILLRMIGPVILIFFLVRLDTSKILEAFANIRLDLFLLATFMAVPSLVIKGLRWQQLLRIFHIKFSLAQCTSMYAACMAFGTVTPGQLGEFSKIWQVAEAGHGYVKSLLASIVDRALDVILIVSLGIGGFIWYAHPADPILSASPRYSILFSSLILTLAATLLMGVFFSRRIVPAAVLKLVQEATSIWRERKNRRRFCAILAATIIYLIFQYCSIYLCAIATGLSIAFPYMVFVFSLSTLLASLPLTVAGVGTRDAVFFYYFTRIGIPPESCLVLSSLVLGLKIANGLLLYILSLVIDRTLPA